MSENIRSTNSSEDLAVRINYKNIVSYTVSQFFMCSIKKMFTPKTFIAKQKKSRNKKKNEYGKVCVRVKFTMYLSASCTFVFFNPLTKTFFLMFSIRSHSLRLTSMMMRKRKRCVYVCVCLCVCVCEREGERVFVCSGKRRIYIFLLFALRVSCTYFVAIWPYTYIFYGNITNFVKIKYLKTNWIGPIIHARLLFIERKKNER